MSYAQTVPQIIKALAEENTASGDGTHDKPLSEVDIYVEEDRITIIPKKTHIIDSATSDIPEQNIKTPIPSHQAGTALAALTISFYFVLILSSLFFQLYSIFNPSTATIYLIPKSQQITLTGTLQLGRVLNPITIPRDAQRAWSRYQSSKNGLATFCHLFDRRSRNTAMMASKMRETFCATFPPTRWKPLHVIRTRENTFSSSPLRDMPLLVLTKRPSAGKIVSNNFGC